MNTVAIVYMYMPLKELIRVKIQNIDIISQNGFQPSSVFFYSRSLDYLVSSSLLPKKCCGMFSPKESTLVKIRHCLAACTIVEYLVQSSSESLPPATDGKRYRHPQKDIMWRERSISNPSSQSSGRMENAKCPENKVL